jgi:alanine racemase
VTDLPGIGLDEEIVLMGSQGGERIDANELARRRGTIPWEVVTGMARRLPRRTVGALEATVRTLAGERRYDPDGR